MLKVVGREKEERAPPLPDLLQVNCSNSGLVESNDNHNLASRALDLEVTAGLLLLKEEAEGRACSPDQEERN